MKLIEKIKNIEHKEKYVYTAMFFAGMFSLSILSAKNSLPEIKKTATVATKQLQQKLKGEKVTATYAASATEDTTSSDDTSTLEAIVSTGIAHVDNNITTSVYKRYDWIEGYGTVNRLVGKKEIDGFSYALDKKNAYNSVNFWVTVPDHDYRRYSQQLLTLKNEVGKKGGKLIFMGFPNKFDSTWDSGYSGIPYNDYNNQMDELLLWNRRYGIDSIDFRTTLKNSGLTWKEMFYKTDHHWTGKAAFLAFKDLVGHLNDKYDAKLDQNGYYRNINNYEIKWHKNIFLGASGRSVGVSFANEGLEDFQTFKPKFDCNITWNKMKGNYTDTVLIPSKLKYDNLYESDPYGYYMNGVCQMDQIINHNNKDGLKVLWIRDSFASPMIVDSIPFCSQIDCVWGKYATDDYVKKAIKNTDYDYVFVAYGTVDLLPNFFHFYENDYPKKD